MIVLTLLLLLGATAFAGDNEKNVTVSTTIDEVATMVVTDEAEGKGNTVTAQGLADGDNYGEPFYVYITTNVHSGVKLTYSVTALVSTTDANYGRYIPLVVTSKIDNKGAVDMPFAGPSRATCSLPFVAGTGMEHHTFIFKVRSSDKNWKTNYKAGTYSTDIIFTLSVNG